jgi:hypothetical protein
MVQKAVSLAEAEPDLNKKTELIDTLRTITLGKVKDSFLMSFQQLFL